MRIVFAGTPAYVVPIVEFLSVECADHDLVAVYTQCDRGAGRGRRLTVGAVKRWAQNQACPVEQPVVWDAPAGERLVSYKPDLMIVAAYGLILPPSVLAIPTFGCVNTHTSLLPRWRGAAPVIRAIEQGDHATGLSLMRMRAGLDDGPVISVKQCAIELEDTAVTLTERLIHLAIDALREFLPDVQAAIAEAQAQSEQGVCYAHKVETAESWIDWTQSAEVIARRIRAFNPAPVARTRLNALVLRVWAAEVCTADAAPGQVVAAGVEGIVVACGTGALRMTLVQPAGKKVMTAAAFANGHDVVEAVLG